MKITTKQKLDVIDIMVAEPKAKNKQIADILGIKASHVASVKHWYKREGKTYTDKLRESLEQSNNLYKLVSDKFQNVGGTQKQQARQHMVNWIASGRMKRGSVLTLPCSDWNIERMIQEQFTQSFNYVACERDINTMAKMVQNLDKFGKNNQVYHGELSDKLFEAKENQYTHIIADYCGTLSKVKKELTHACMNNIVKKNGTIAVTLLKARTDNNLVNDLNNLKSELTGNQVRDNDNESAIKMFFHILCSITDFEVVQEFCYGDTSPMILIVLKRTR